ncbi:hypothetical protein [Ramlibacter sp.]|uniref:hypothetical protein n=1 Tax=Ramlibacter sp. TaxID=1917967 RepID=UPI002C825A3F|nr:hypothetical protein [Ramlibacter sp.]HWI83905.1 hypothetical protein [Ramlibacter sp.]
MPSPKQPPPDAKDEKLPKPPPASEERGSNAVEHEPDPRADPIPDGDHPYVKRSPYTSGNY